MKKRIVIISEVFYPSTTTTAHIMTDVADSLSRQFDVEVITTGSLYDSTNDNAHNIANEEKSYPIKRIKGSGYDKNNILSRICGLVTTSFRLISRVIKDVKKNDNVLIVTNPAPLLLLIALLRKIKGFNLTILVHDVFPENTIAAGLIKSDKNILYRFFRLIFNKAYSSADNLILLGRDMTEVMGRKIAGKKNPPSITIIENWADPITDEMLKERNPDVTDNVKILYAGNVGRVQGLESFIDVVNQARNPIVRFTMRGDGANAEEIKTKLDAGSYPHIAFEGKFARSEQFDILSDCDLSLVTLSEGMYGLGVPSKSYNIMEAGKPILFIGDPDSEIALMVKEHDIGYCFTAEDQESVIDWLSRLTPDWKEEFRKKGERARRLSQTHYSKEIGLDKFNKLFS